MSMRTSAGGRLKILVVISPQLVYQAPGTIYTHAVAMEVRIRWGGAPREGSKIGTAPQPRRQVLTTIHPKNGSLGAPRHDSCERGLEGGMYQARDAIYCSFWPISSGLVPGRGWVPSRPNWRLVELLRSPAVPRAEQGSSTRDPKCRTNVRGMWHSLAFAHCEAP